MAKPRAKHLEEFKKAQPRLDFLISVLISDVFSGPWKNRFIIIFFMLFNTFVWYLVFLHLKNGIGNEININILISILMFLLLCQYLIRIVLGLFNRTKFTVLMQNIKDLFEEQDEDPELSSIMEFHLKNSVKYFVFFDRLIMNMVYGAIPLASLYFRYNEDYGLMYDLPFVVSDNIFMREFMYVLQGVILMVVSYPLISLDFGIIFIGLQIIAELNILNDFMKIMNVMLKSQPNFLKRIIKKHCVILTNINLLSDIILETSFMQLFLSCITFMFGFSFLMKYSAGVGNYMIMFAGIIHSLPVCVLGEFIKRKTDNLSETLYQTNWYELSLKDQKTFLIILGMAQREYGLKAGGMYDINLYTFIQVCFFINLKSNN
uniref:Odorant receptor n=1 Tax=Lutzomyia longipalpis TaxID=7200 RepID=A0A7G3AES9_LUTLO